MPLCARRRLAACTVRRIGCCAVAAQPAVAVLPPAAAAPHLASTSLCRAGGGDLVVLPPAAAASHIAVPRVVRPGSALRCTVNPEGPCGSADKPLVGMVSFVDAIPTSPLLS